MGQVQISQVRKAMDTAVESRDSYVSRPGVLDEALVRFISGDKDEPEWMLQKRLKALELFMMTPVPAWGPDLGRLDMGKIVFYRKPDAKQAKDWRDVPAEIKKTFDALGIPEAEQKSLAGAGAQYESSVIYHRLKGEFERQGVIFEDMDVALHKYPELVKKYFMTNCIPISDHKFIMLHGAVWSGGTFIYVPRNVKVRLPLQAYFRMNAKRGGQFEHTLIVAEEGSEVNYVEGCSAPQFGDERSLHAGCVEIYVGENARVRYSSVENWSTSTFNLNTKRAIVQKNGIIEWVGGNMGSCTTMLYPCSILKGEGARADHLGIAYAGRGQNQDTGAKVYHLAKNTSSNIRMKSISKDGGICTYRGLVKVVKGAKDSRVAAACDALIMDKDSVSNTIPNMDVGEDGVHVSHEARVGRLSAEKVFYLMSRGIKEDDAVAMMVSGFIEPVIKELPLEYAVELNRLIQLEMVGAIG